MRTDGDLTDRTAPAAVVDEVCACIAEVAGLDRNSVTPQVSLLDIGIESLTLVDIIFRLERIFDVRLPPHLALLDDNACPRRYADAIAQALTRGERGPK